LQAVRAALSLHKGGKIAHAIKDSRVVLTRVRPEMSTDNPVLTFSERNSPADTDAHL